MKPRTDSSAGSLRTTLALSTKVIVSCLVAVVLVGALDFLSTATTPPSGYDVVPADSTAPPNAQAVYQAANAVQNLNAYFRLTGVSLLPPASLTDGWELGLDLRGFGTGDKQEPLGGAQLTPDGRRIEYSYSPASLSAWFVNNEDGLRYGVSVDAPIGGSAAKIFVDLAVSGNLTPRLSEGGEVIEFVTESGAVVLSTGLVEVIDAAGEKVHAYAEVLSSQAVRLWIEVAGAAYPVTAEWATGRITPPATPSPDAPEATITVCNTSPITIPGSGTGTTTGSPASLYPSSITVTGVGLISKVTVNLKGLNHTFPSDVDMLLVGPGGSTKLINLSDVIGGTDWVGINYTLDDAAAAVVPSSGTPVSGTFRPTNYGTGDVFPAPAPAGPYQNPATAGSATLASVFGGTNADGTWSLYIVDDAGGDTGSMTGGWCVNLTQGCVTNANCNDSNPCTTDTCVSGSCVYTATCNDNDACTTDLCDTGTGACSHGVTNCDDLNPCTNDTCAPATGCAHSNNTASCTDGNPCTVGDTCSGGTCVGTPGNCPVAQICNPGAVTIPAGAPATTIGPALPYPTAIVVTGITYAANVKVDLKGLNHTFPDDIDMLLVGPGGQNAKIMSDVGSLTDIVNVNLTLSDGAGSSLPDGGPIVSGTFKPTDVNDGTDTFPAPAPVPSGGSALSVFTGTNPTGTWNLYIVDDVSVDVGSMAGGWCVDITYPCATNADCNDQNPCTTDTCNAGICTSTPLSGSCEDGNACTIGDTCAGTVCQPGPSLPCEDNNACTSNDCNPSSGQCLNTPIICNDNNACTANTCNPSTGCVYTTNVFCDDGEVCTTDTCNPSNGTCVFAGNTNACDDGNACTAGDQCTGGGFLEYFDSVTAPALPAGWTSSFTGAGQNWVTQNTSSDTPPNSAFGFDGFTGTVVPGEEVLTSPPIPITSSTAKLSFRNRWSFENPTTCYDAGVLEIKIGAGSFTDIVTAGGSFVTGGYTGTVNNLHSNPLSNQSAWCNNSAGYPAYLTTNVNLPAAAAGQTIQLRWRVGFDDSLGAVGQNIDTISILDTSTCRSGPPAPAATACGDPSSGPCDGADHCTGINGSCDPNHAVATTTCGDAEGPCTNQDYCNGSGGCQDNGFKPTTTTCGDAEAACTNQDYCNGSGACHDNGFKPAVTACGDPSSGPCDSADHCSGFDASCDPNHAATTTTCGDAEGPCTNQDYCDGTGLCHDNGYKPAATACGDPSSGPCDNPDHCTGIDGSCDPNHEATTTTCGDAEAQCTNQDYCDGTGLCHDNGFKPAATACGDPSSGPCDNPDHCTGIDASCDPNHEATTTTCGDAEAQCTNQDYCDGTGLCHDNGFKPAATACGDPSSGPCDSADHCTGTNASCDPNHASTSTTCGDAETQCINQDYCDGTGLCHDNGFKPTTTPCTDGDACTTGDLCDGAGACSPGGPTNCDDSQCCTNDLCDHDTGCYHTPYTIPPVIVTQPTLGCALLWPPQHGYVDFTIANTGATASSQCGIASITFASCSSSQQENAHGVGDGNSNRDCVYTPGTLSVRAERDGACSPIGRSYSSTVVATDVCGNVSAPSNSFDIGVFHDRGHAPPPPYYSANPGSNQNDERPGVNGTYGTGCGNGTCGATGTGHDSSDADPEMEILQNASISVGNLGLEKASGGNARLTWSEPTHQAGIIVTRFHVYRLDPVTLFWTQIAEVTKQTTSYLDPVLNDGLNHEYKVTAVIKP